MIYATLSDVTKLVEELKAALARLKAAEDAVLLHERDAQAIDVRLRALEILTR